MRDGIRMDRRLEGWISDEGGLSALRGGRGGLPGHALSVVMGFMPFDMVLGWEDLAGANLRWGVVLGSIWVRRAVR